MKKKVVLAVLAFVFLLAGCGNAGTAPERELETQPETQPKTEMVLGPIVKLETDPELEKQPASENDLYGFYIWDGCLSESLFFSGTRETPIYYLSEYEFIPILRHPYFFYPLNGNGVYYDVIVHTDGSEAPDHPNISYESAECDQALFEEAGVDISGYQHREQFAATNTIYDYALYRMDDEIWLTGWWERGNENFVIRLRKDDHYDLVPAVYKGENVRLLRDLTAPQMPDVTNPNMTKEALLAFIGQTGDSRIAAYLHNANIDNWNPHYYDCGDLSLQQDDGSWYDEYIVLEFYDGELRYIFTYLFWDSAEHYEKAKEEVYWSYFHIHNDALLMTFNLSVDDYFCDSYDWLNGRGKDYDDLLTELKSRGYRIL